MSTSCSLQPSSASPPKSSGPRSWPCIQVPNAPSNTSTRSASASRNGCCAPLPTGRSMPRGSCITPGYAALASCASECAPSVDSKTWHPRSSSSPPRPTRCVRTSSRSRVFTGPHARPRRRCRRPSARRHAARLRGRDRLRRPSAASRSPCPRAVSSVRRLRCSSGMGDAGLDRRRRDAARGCGAGAASVQGREGRHHVARRRARLARSGRRRAGARRRASRSAPTSSSPTSRTPSPRGSLACRCSGRPTRRFATGWRAAPASRRRSCGRATS